MVLPVSLSRFFWVDRGLSSFHIEFKTRDLVGNFCFCQSAI